MSGQPTGPLLAPLVASLRAELRKALSVRTWWALGIPVIAMSIIYNLFGAVLSGGYQAGEEEAVLVPLLSLAYAMVLTAVFGAVAGIIGAAGEFRHQTASTTYLLTPSRGRVLVAKLLVGGALGASYVLVAAAVGIPAGRLGTGEWPPPGLLVGLVGLGMLVAALWSAIGVALGTATGNQVGALVGTLVYLLLVDRLCSLLLGASDVPAVAALASFLPGKAADIVVYDYLVRGLGADGLGPALVAAITSVGSPPPWWVALLVLIGWTAAAGVLAWRLNERRDIS